MNIALIAHDNKKELMAQFCTCLLYTSGRQQQDRLLPSAEVSAGPGDPRTHELSLPHGCAGVAAGWRCVGLPPGHGGDPGELSACGLSPVSYTHLEALELPLLAVPTGGEEYHLSMEAALRRAKEQGAELVCFGDIDMENNRAWGEERCRNVGLEAVYPLWHHDRQENVREVLELGYRCLIKTLDRRVLPRHLLGRVMDRAMVEEMTACGVDVCGENGEFHTIAEMCIRDRGYPAARREPASPAPPYRRTDP